MITGGAGFIGSNFISQWLADKYEHSVINLDLLTYAGNLSSYKPFSKDERHIFVKGSIGDSALVGKILDDYKPDAIVNFAAESHVDRSIYNADDFIQTNVVDTHYFLCEVHKYWNNLKSVDRKKNFRIVHVSTDEVYGSLEEGEAAFFEASPYRPNNPYAASKAASDHLVRSFHRTYGLPVMVTNSSNNYGPYQYPEKLIPLMIFNAVTEKKLPIYGDGSNIRDWIYAPEHCAAIHTVLFHGEIGESYNVGGCSEKTNIEVVHTICDFLDEIVPKKSGISYKEQIQFIKDRPGHDKHYAIDISKISKNLHWNPKENFISGLRKTILWYLKNIDWVSEITGESYKDWVKLHYN